MNDVSVYIKVGRQRREGVTNQKNAFCCTHSLSQITSSEFSAS